MESPMTLKSLLFAAALAFAPVAAAAHEYTLGALVIGHPMAFETPAHAMAGGGFLTVTNTGTAPDRLVGARSAAARTEIHRSVEENGVMKMLPMEEGIEIPAGGTVTLAPGGLHVMFMGLSAPLTAGAKFPVTLVFEKAGEIEVEFAIEARGDAAAGHGGHAMPGAGQGAHAGHGAPSN